MLLIIPYDPRLPRMKMTGKQRSRPHQALMNVYCCPFDILALGTLSYVCTMCMYLCLRFPLISKFGTGQQVSTLPATRVSWHHHLSQSKEAKWAFSYRKGPCRHTLHVHPTASSSSKSSIWTCFAWQEIVLVSILN